VNILEASAWLDAHVNLESLGRPVGESRRAVAPTLDRIEALTQHLGSPQFDVPAIHITGTNGKTSVSRMITALLMSAGVNVGTYTSPHLSRVNERLSSNGEPITDRDLAALLTQIRLVEPYLQVAPSYFEILTAAAFSWFSDLPVGAGVIEVGLGGRWDATNVIDAQVAVVTNVSIDHVEYLGPTRADIATEKAGIVKPGSTLVLGETDPALVPIFEATEAAHFVRRGADFGVANRRSAIGGQVVDLYSPTGQYTDVLIPLHGAYQADNAAIALAAAEVFLDATLDAEWVFGAFATVDSPGRLEVVGHHPLVLLDGAHNVAGATALVRALEDEFAAGPRTLVVGLLREKEPREMLEAFDVVNAELLVCTRPPSPRALEPEALAAAARTLGVANARIVVIDDPQEAVAYAIDEAEIDGRVIVTGSLYLVGAVRSAFTTGDGDK
jgi:dihydrofolate synthase/folylpolyglutamate synthase